MIEKLIEEIQKNGSIEIRSIARKMGLEVEMVQSMVHHLIQMGRIKPYQTCEGACNGCSLSSECKPGVCSDQTPTHIRLFTYNP